MAEPIIIPAIAEDGRLFPIEKMHAHRAGQHHLAISVFLFSGDELLIQRRAAGKYHCGGQWANTCCSHPHWGEAPRASALRRLGEELGIAVPLFETGIVDYRADVGDGLIEHERVHVFRGTSDKRDLSFRLDPEEVAETRWITLSDLHDWMARDPDALTPWFRIYLSRWNDLHLAA